MPTAVETGGFTPFSFILPKEYLVPPEKKVLFVMPCSKEKPYSRSYTHRVMEEAMGFRPWVHKVTLSGLYGPVPEEFEEVSDAVTSYDYLLEEGAYGQIALVASRMTAFLLKYGHCYQAWLGYATVEPYRSVIEGAFLAYGKGRVFPTDLVRKDIESFWDPTNLGQLNEALSSIDICHGRLDI